MPRAKTQQSVDAFEMIEHVDVEKWAAPLPPDRRQVRRINVSDLIVDRKYQRALTNDDGIARMAYEWDWNLSEAPTVVEIGNGAKCRVIEGQRRVRALQMRDPEASMWCVVLEGKQAGVRNEAAIGLQVSKGRVSFKAIDVFEARVRCGDEHEVAALEVLDDLGLRLGHTASSRTIASAGSIMRLIHGALAPPELGAEFLRNTLLVLMTAWPKDDIESSVSRFDNRLFDVVGSIVSRNDAVDLDRLARKLRSKAAHRWIKDVTNTDVPLKAAVRASILFEYNRGLHKAHRISTTTSVTDEA